MWRLNQLYRRTPQEEAERAIIRANVRNKTFLTAFTLAVMFYVFSSNSADTTLGHVKNGIVELSSISVFFFALIFGRLFFLRHETDASKRRLAEQDYQAQQALQRQRREEEQQRQRIMEEASRNETLAHEYQNRRDQREHFLMKLRIAILYIDHLDSGNSDANARARILKGLSDELSELIRAYNAAERAEIIARDQDVREMVTALGRGLSEKRINSVEGKVILEGLHFTKAAP